MTTEQSIAILSIVAIVVVLRRMASLNWRKWWYSMRQPTFPPAASKRTDLYFGFYGADGNQINETANFVNLYMESQWNGMTKAVSDIASLPKHIWVMLDVSPQLFVKGANGKYKLRDDAKDRLQDLFTSLSHAGCLHKIVALYPIDEPNNTVGDANELGRAIGVLQDAAKGFPLLGFAQLATTYAADKPFIGQHLFHWVGYNDYDMGAALLTSKKFKEFCQSLAQHQRVMLIPGGAYGQDPVPFVNYAQSNPKVAIVLPFLWTDTRTFDVGALGIRSNGMAEAYAIAGTSVISRS